MTDISRKQVRRILGPGRSAPLWGLGWGGIALALSTVIAAGDGGRRGRGEPLPEPVMPARIACADLEGELEAARAASAARPSVVTRIDGTVRDTEGFGVQCGDRLIRVQRVPVHDTGGLLVKGAIQALVSADPQGITVHEVCMGCDDDWAPVGPRPVTRHFGVFSGVAGVLSLLLAWVRRSPRRGVPRRAYGRAPEAWSPGVRLDDGRWHAEPLGGPGGAPEPAVERARIEVGPAGGYRGAAAHGGPQLVGPGVVNGLRVARGGRAAVGDGDIVRVDDGPAFRLRFPGWPEVTSLRYHGAPDGDVRLLRHVPSRFAAVRAVAAIAAAGLAAVFVYAEHPGWFGVSMAALAGAAALGASLPPGLRVLRAVRAPGSELAAPGLELALGASSDGDGTFALRRVAPTGVEGAEHVIEEVPAWKRGTPEERALHAALVMEARSLVRPAPRG